MEEHEVLHIISQEKAKELKMKFYFTGKPCNRNHVSKRYVSGGSCIECFKLTRKKYYEENKEYYSEYAKGAYIKHREYRLEKQKAYRKNNKEAVKESQKKGYLNNIDKERQRRRDYYKNNKPKIKKYNEEHKDQMNEKRRERYKNNFNYRLAVLIRSYQRKITKVCFRDGLEAHEGRVDKNLEEIHNKITGNLLTGMTLDNFGDWHIDHKYPIIRYLQDGVTDPQIINGVDNLIPMWAKHNIEKQDKTLEEWLTEKGEYSEEYALYSKFLN